MIEIMDQLSPAILESVANVAVSDAVSCRREPTFDFTVYTM